MTMARTIIQEQGRRKVKEEELWPFIRSPL